MGGVVIRRVDRKQVIYSGIILLVGVILLAWSLFDYESPMRSLAWAMGGAIWGALVGWHGRGEISNWKKPFVALSLIAATIVATIFRYSPDEAWTPGSLGFVMTWATIVVYNWVPESGSS